MTIPTDRHLGSGAAARYARRALMLAVSALVLGSTAAGQPAAEPRAQVRPGRNSAHALRKAGDRIRGIVDTSTSVIPNVNGPARALLTGDMQQMMIAP